MRSFHLPGRSPVYARNAMCATSHPHATLAAVECLRSGGNAVDAAITAAGVLCVVEHPMTGIGGDCFAVLAKPGQKPIALNSSGFAPQAATAAWYAKQGITSIAVQSPHAVTVPGSIDGWTTLLKDHGMRSIGDALAPAIALARGGFPVAPRVATDWGRALVKIKANPGMTAHFLRDGRAPRAGEVMKLPALAKTLERIAKEGRDGFYAGEIAEDMVGELKALGGLHTLDDFAAQKCSYVTPISVDYRGTELHELPPNLHGIVALILLKMMTKLGKQAADPTSAERYHVLMEAARLAYAMRDTFVADPQTAKVPVEHMLSDSVIADLVKRIDPARKSDLGPVPHPAGSDTVYLAIVDKDGMAVSFINSLFADFGSGIATKKSGVVFHNRATGFVLDPKHPNCIAPRKRPMHTLIPALATRGGKPALAFGVMGAAFQPMGHVYMMSNIVDYGMDPQEALDCPRVFFEGEHLFIEEGVSPATAQRLAMMGHSVRMRDLPWGGGQIVSMGNPDGMLIGASDHRKDGLALGY